MMYSGKVEYTRINSTQLGYKRNRLIHGHTVFYVSNVNCKAKCYEIDNATDLERASERGRESEEKALKR